MMSLDEAIREASRGPAGCQIPCDTMGAAESLAKQLRDRGLDAYAHTNGPPGWFLVRAKLRLQ